MTQERIQDTPRNVDVQEHATVFHGAIWDIQRDSFIIEATDQPMTREYMQHPGAVAIVAVDTTNRVAMVRQYRHPLGQDCWEIPAGLRDIDGEDMITTAQRELAEEADLIADNWSVLIDHCPSGGSSSEAIRIFLAQELRSVPPNQRHTRQAEEAHLALQWVPLQDALTAILAGDVRNGNAVAGIMAAQLVLQGQHAARPIEATF